jgi:hypothetical protein
MFRISEYAQISIPDAWQGWRNPVHDSSLDELGINLRDLEFDAVTPGGEAQPGPVNEPASAPVARVFAAARELVVTQLRLGCEQA